MIENCDRLSPDGKCSLCKLNYYYNEKIQAC